MPQPFNLPNPKVSKPINKGRVASIKIEDNNEVYVEIWAIMGRVVGKNFEDLSTHATNGQKNHTYFKIKDGIHPFLSGKLSGKCSNCNAWHKKTTGDCEKPGCGGVDTIEPYGGLTELTAAVETFSQAIQDFLEKNECAPISFYDNVEDKWTLRDENPADYM